MLTVCYDLAQPRAAARAAGNAKGSSSSFTNRLGDADDSETLVFSTLPPTPNDAAKKRSAAQTKENPRAKVRCVYSAVTPLRSC